MNNRHSSDTLPSETKKKWLAHAKRLQNTWEGTFLLKDNGTLYYDFTYNPPFSGPIILI